ncbi:integrase/recombinase [Salmonella enterica subsp. arizonae]|uniref:Integrase/recombinase n=1 Tax=Salmonella enterica subsp. arizonae TaxID=59203 RepID=A0A379T345_SALER|nr:integrase/recombinase [Salmonella enterica subsp. arizonae]
MTDVALSQDVSRFLRYLGVERQLSPITLLNYQRQLDAIIALAGEAGLKSWQQCDAVMVRVLRCAVDAKGLALPVWRYVSRHCVAFLTG